MKKLAFLVVMLIAFPFAINAQDEDGGSPTDQGSWVIEINTGFGEASRSNTGFGLWSVDGNTSWAIGGEAGYFVIDDLAIKAGLGYSDAGIDGIDGQFNWKFGGKYYIVGSFPIGLDLNGSAGNDFTPLYLGIQGGYAWFVADNVSIEPGLRYGFGLNDDAGDGDFNVFGILMGFNFYF